MSNPTQPRPKDSPDEQTIEENLKKMDYPAKEDIMRQNEEINVDDLGNVNKQAATAKEVDEEGN